MAGAILLNPGCYCGPPPCSTFYCPACNEYLLIDQGAVTDDNGTWPFDTSGTTAPIGDAGYWYVLDCTTHAPSVTLTEHYLDEFSDEVAVGSISTPSSCDPLTSSHSFSGDPSAPAPSATVSIPKASGFTCSPCCVPGKVDGPLSLTLAGGPGAGTYTMGFGSIGASGLNDPAWGVGIPAINGLVGFGCTGDGHLGIYTTSSNIGTVPCLTTVIADSSCDPFHIHFTRTSASCVNFYWTDFTVDGP